METLTNIILSSMEATNKEGSTKDAKLMALSYNIQELQREIHGLYESLVREQNLNQLLNLTMMLKSAVLSINAHFPPLESFEYYLKRLTNREDLHYVITLIRRCWEYVNNAILVRPSKYDLLEMLDMADEAYLENVSKGEGEKPILGEFFSTADIDKDNYELDLWVKNLLSDTTQRRRQYFGWYMKSLYEICKGVCESFHEELRYDFIIPLVIPTSLTRTQIENVYKAVAGKGKMNNDPETGAAFMALFSPTTNANEKRVEWLDVAKNKQPNYSSLYKMLEVMGVDMSDRSNLEKICNAFYVTNKDTGNMQGIKIEQLRCRENTKSLYELESLVKNALGKP